LTANGAAGEFFYSKNPQKLVKTITNFAILSSISPKISSGREEDYHFAAPFDRVWESSFPPARTGSYDPVILKHSDWIEDKLCKICKNLLVM